MRPAAGRPSGRRSKRRRASTPAGSSRRRAIALRARHHLTRAARPEYDARSARTADASDNGLRHPARYGQNDCEIAETGKQWLSFNAREDALRGITVGTTIDVLTEGASRATPALVTEVLPLGSFATWQAERAAGDHDRNALRLRLDPQGDVTKFAPGLTVWFHR
jgi:hypothetical protein